MEKDELAALKLDEEFKINLALIRPYIQSISSIQDTHLCRLWLDKLNQCSPQERKLRNLYISKLCYQVKCGELVAPFKLPPPVGELQDIFSLQTGTKDDLNSSSWSDITESTVCRPRWRTADVESSAIDSGDSQLLVIPRKESEHVQCLQLQRHYEERIASDQAIINRYQQALGLLLANRNSKENSNDSKISKIQDKYEKKVLSLTTTIAELQNKNSKLNQELDCYKKSLRLFETFIPFPEEAKTLKDKLTELQKMKSALECTHKEVISHYQNEMKVSIKNLSQRLQETQARAKKLDENLDVVMKRMETMEDSNDSKIQRESGDQNSVNYHHKQQHKDIQDLIIIEDLKTQLTSKDTEILRLDSLLKERWSQMQEEVNSIKQSMQQSFEKTEQNFKAKISELQKKVGDYERLNAEMTKDYDYKLYHLEKEKNIEVKSLKLQLQTQKADITTTMIHESKQELEELLSNLEDRYKELLTETENTFLKRQHEDEKRINELEAELAAGIVNSM